MKPFLKEATGAVLMLLGLVGLVDNVVVWRDFILEINDRYSEVREYLFSLLFVPVPESIQNYFVVGSGFAFAFVRALEKGINSALEEDPKDAFMLLIKRQQLGFINLAYTCALVSTLWPYFLAQMTPHPYNTRDQWQRYNSVWRQVFFVIMILLGLIFLGSDLLTR